jgi:amino acid permease
MLKTIWTPIFKNVFIVFLVPMALCYICESTRYFQVRIKEHNTTTTHNHVLSPHLWMIIPIIPSIIFVSIILKYWEELIT